MITSTTNIHEVARITVQRVTFEKFDTVEFTLTLTSGAIVELTAFLVPAGAAVETLPDRVV